MKKTKVIIAIFAILYIVCMFTSCSGRVKYKMVNVKEEVINGEKHQFIITTSHKGRIVDFQHSDTCVYCNKY